MSRSVPERLRDLEAEVQNLQVLPAAAVRARGRSRGRRQVAASIAAGVVVVAAVGVAFAWPSPQRTTPTADLPTAGPVGLSCVLTLPDGNTGIQIRVLDGGTSAELLSATVSQLQVRSFTVLDDTTGDDPAGATALRYGPTAIGAAALLRAELNDEVTMRFDPDRREATIDLTLGPAFTRLATPTEINQNLVSIGEPTAPPECSKTVSR